MLHLSFENSVTRDLGLHNLFPTPNFHKSDLYSLCYRFHHQLKCLSELAILPHLRETHYSLLSETQKLEWKMPVKPQKKKKKKINKKKFNYL